MTPILADRGEVYTWGWRECVPTYKVNADQNPRALASGADKDLHEAHAEEKDGGDEGLFPKVRLNQIDLIDSIHTRHFYGDKLEK